MGEEGKRNDKKVVMEGEGGPGIRGGKGRGGQGGRGGGIREDRAR